MPKCSFNLKSVCYYYNISDLVAFIQRQSAAICRSKQSEKVLLSLNIFQLTVVILEVSWFLVAGNPGKWGFVVAF